MRELGMDYLTWQRQRFAFGIAYSFKQKYICSEQWIRSRPLSRPARTVTDNWQRDSIQTVPVSRSILIVRNLFSSNSIAFNASFNLHALELSPDACDAGVWSGLRSGSMVMLLSSSTLLLLSLKSLNFAIDGPDTRRAIGWPLSFAAYAVTALKSPLHGWCRPAIRRALADLRSLVCANACPCTFPYDCVLFEPLEFASVSMWLFCAFCRTWHNSSKLFVPFGLIWLSHGSMDGIFAADAYIWLALVDWQLAIEPRPLLFTPLKLLATLLWHGATVLPFIWLVILLLLLVIWFTDEWWPSLSTCMGDMHSVPSPFVWICWMLATIDW